MYRQSINSIKVVIIPLDGVIFDLNRFRYNYYHHLCDNKNIPISKKDFYPHLSNMYDMYKDLPLDGKVDTGPLNAKIERELMQYLDYKGLKPNEGFLELLEYLHQKEIQVAVISTHRTKDAVHYLQAAKIYNKVHFIIGSDTSSMPLPSTQMLETITNHFHVHTVETLVISSFMSLNYAANELNMNIIYCEDLIPAGKLEMETSYKICKNLFEVLNTLLFDQYEESEMYSSILGMNADMSLDELNKVKDRLEQTYCNDHQILDVVNKTYSYYVTQLNQQNIKDGSVLFKNAPHRKKFQFNDESQTIQETPPQESLLQEIQHVAPEKDIEQNEIHISSLDNEEEETLTRLLQQINKTDESIEKTPMKVVTDYQEIEDIVKSSYQEDIINEEQQESFSLSLIINVLYIFAISFLILFIGIIIYIAFVNQFASQDGIFKIISSLFHIYYSFIEGFFACILNGLHAIIKFIPSYQEYAMTNAFFSLDGIPLLNIFVFHALLISSVKIIIFIIKRRNVDEVID